uniref:Bestrophin homolog n=1 Tax=Panagrolaimus sp. ES5 TaxID=591445 RepID=A0AC34F989_9BILA
MTITYNLDVPHSHFKGVLSILFRWRGSVWKAVSIPLLCWLIAYYFVFCIYFFLLRPYDKHIFDKVTDVLENRIDTFIPMTFILGFFVSSVLGRWQDCLKNMGWIDGTAMSLATYIRGSDDETRAIRRTIIRYLVLSQTFVLRNVSVQVRRRFPTQETIIAADLMTSQEQTSIEETEDSYSQFWIPIFWALEVLNDAKEKGKISSDFVAEKIVQNIDDFRSQLQNLLKFDWVPIPLVYPQLVTFCVRLYFFICLFTRQIIKSDDTGLPESPLFWIPLTTIIEFVVYMGWLKVAEDMLHPLGDDFDNLECNYIIDKNLITGLSLVDRGGKPFPSPKKDAFWDTQKIAPLYSFTTAHRTVTPMTGSAANINYVQNIKEIFMVPHKSKLIKMSEEEQRNSFQKVNVKNDKLNEKKMTGNAENEILNKLKQRFTRVNLNQISVETPLLVQN